MGKSLAQAAKEAGVTYNLWSSLPNAERISGGKWVSAFVEAHQTCCVSANENYN